MDVHPPHGGIHTWKDFWIHLGTITIGLLIAIGLEQSVEWMHRVHQQHVLERDLMDEVRKNDELIRRDYQYDNAMRAWLKQMIQQVAAAREDGGKTKVQFSKPSGTVALWWADSPVWNTAKESAELSLLPREEGRMYDLVYVQQEAMATDIHHYFDIYGKQLSFEGRFNDLRTAAGPDLTKMDAQDLREYQALLNDTMLQMRVIYGSVSAADAATTAVLNGAKSYDDVMDAMSRPAGAAAKK